MNSSSFLSLLAVCVAFFFHQPPVNGEDANPLEGAWVGQSMQVDGQPAPAAAAKNMRFTFQGEKLLIRGNFADDKEESCSYKVDLKQSPMHLEFTPPNEEKPILGIFEVKDDQLKICMRHASSDEGRPTEFATTKGSRLILLVLKRQK